MIEAAVVKISSGVLRSCLGGCVRRWGGVRGVWCVAEILLPGKRSEYAEQ